MIYGSLLNGIKNSGTESWNSHLVLSRVGANSELLAVSRSFAPVLVVGAMEYTFSRRQCLNLTRRRRLLAMPSYFLREF